MSIAGVSGSSTVPPSNTSSITVSGTIDPLTGVMTITVLALQPTGDTSTGVHLYLEVPDRSASAADTVGSSFIGTDKITGKWNPVDLGVQPYSAAQPWTVTALAPLDVNPTIDTPARLYVASVSPTVDTPLVQAGLTGATPNQTFTLVSGASRFTAQAGTNVTETSGIISASVLTPDTSTGTILFPVLVNVSTVPAIPGWSARLVVTWQGKDPGAPANQSVVTDVFHAAGDVYGSPDSIATPHSFTLTSNTIQAVTVWLQAGLMDANGNYRWNNIVPGITPSATITVGVSNGRTLDGTAITEESIAIDHFAAGIRPVSIFTANPTLPDPLYPPGAFGYNITTPAFLKVNAAGTAWIKAVNGGADIQAGTVTATQIDTTILNAAQVSAAYASFTYLAANYITASSIAATYASFTYLGANYITAATISATYANITTVAATYATISALNAKTITANSITTGTCSASVSFTAPTLTITNGTNTVNIDAINYIALTSTSLSSKVYMAPGFLMAQSTVDANVFAQVSHDASNGYVEVRNSAGNATALWPGTATSAVGGAATLPSNPVGFFKMRVNGTIRLVPFY